MRAEKHWPNILAVARDYDGGGGVDLLYSHQASFPSARKPFSIIKCLFFLPNLKGSIFYGRVVAPQAREIGKGPQGSCQALEEGGLA